LQSITVINTTASAPNTSNNNIYDNNTFCNICTVASNEKILTQVGFSSVTIYIWAHHTNSWAKSHFVVGL